ncbi:MAG: glycosyltransferase family 2 protein [Terriglobia bacterium]
MKEQKHQVCVIVPTVGRRDALRRMLNSLANQSRRPAEVIVIGEDVTDVVQQFTPGWIRFIYRPKPSSAQARNVGVQAADPGTDLVAFFDDDIVLEPEAFTRMMEFWDQAPPDLGGAGFNWANYPSKPPSGLKTAAPFRWFGLYSGRGGDVVRSGFHVPLRTVTEDTFVKWLPSGAVIFRKSIFSQVSFDEWFSGYGHLEDLDLSYRIGKQWRLVVVSSARFNHYPSPVGRPSAYLFGKMEILNRLRFVSKRQELSIPLCYVFLLLQTSLKVGTSLRRRDFRYLRMAAGNVVGLALSIRGWLSGDFERGQTHSEGISR